MHGSECTQSGDFGRRGCLTGAAYALTDGGHNYIRRMIENADERNIQRRI